MSMAHNTLNENINSVLFAQYLTNYILVFNYMMEPNSALDDHRLGMSCSKSSVHDNNDQLQDDTMICNWEKGKNNLISKT